MRIKTVHLTNYKRFTNLLISSIPESARLVVMIGPNGSGKSSVFDSFLLKSQGGGRYNYDIGRQQDNVYQGYYLKDPDSSASSQSTRKVWNSIKVEFHSGEPTNDAWSHLFRIRTPYRNEADFRLSALERPTLEIRQLQRIIDPDESVSENYKWLAWKTIEDVHGNSLSKISIEEYSKEFLGGLQRVMRRLFSSPPLELQDFGGQEDYGVFRFTKGTAKDFHYKNLSGGEKAAFDLLLDIFVKRTRFKDAVYCIDEPESHVASGLHGPLLDAMLEIVPERSQLWIATHSIGFVRKAYDLMHRNEDVVFLDFSKHDFDQEVRISPRIPDRSFWQATYQVALDDLADLIAPDIVILCEGDKIKADKGFDARCYNLIFAEDYSDTLFISRGSSSEVEKSEDLIGVLQAVAKGSTIWRLIDRDDMSDEGREEKIKEGVRVLGRRELENYLYDPKVLKTFLKMQDKEKCAEGILEYHEKELLSARTMMDADLTKDKTRNLFAFIKKSTQLGNLGNTRDEFALHHLAPALRQTPSVYQELRADIFH
ncbi:MAG: AAA family ATPase [Caldilineaceae bacterium]|nr:AAA family ATPase [Caldilineaceae bacterium]